ncbi:hypothetical protein LEP1GSC193_0469 [Leptospira alstonii serovar Pingchang str. 80-412]|uniref:Uncharacterized protein n=2 Tax=Leptospira alstonii TaxID=28452 RepID=M6D7L2_9LEPT|nr:hypothetical protein LEP1GSC194_1429 [Leptospira alstonii serovar Sichuan str. 79601]EQA79513.1 hypothetical protein LEP1GSC193_0469 [Leptospira alstonii serovar Pingchang str. 80-412]
MKIFFNRFLGFIVFFFTIVSKVISNFGRTVYNQSAKE